MSSDIIIFFILILQLRNSPALTELNSAGVENDRANLGGNQEKARIRF